MATGQPVVKVHISVTPEGSFRYDVG
jgi:hypothetical protein